MKIVVVSPHPDDETLGASGRGNTAEVSYAEAFEIIKEIYEK